MAGREDDEPRRNISTNCRRLRDEPGHSATCSGCDCPCHYVAVPPGFRELVEQLKAEAES